ncbi:hypothetical protein [Thermodesulfatator indicus]|uniref:hypothetical protein n=1 Tax=Thermodesulfatator indicus TaxID=171695 RepID=UPI0011D18737|nr:hypothetical protein [Thermodesulfatator indicus]
MVKTYLINYFKPAVGAGFPNVLMSISEAKHFELIQIAHISAGNILVFILGFAGVVLLFIKRFKETFLLIPIFLIGIMALKGGNRFAMYLSPFIGMGIGYFLDELITYISFKRKLNTFYHYAISLIVIFLVVTVFLFSNKESFSFVAKPKITPSLEENFIKLQDLTPLNSWIWTWWDYGTAIQYLAARAVFHDGQSQGSPKTYFVATSFSSPDPQIARNIILGISNIGAEGIKELSENGKTPEEIKKLIFSGAFSKPVNNPIYWAFTEDLIGKFAWINFFGTWDFQTKRGKKAPIVPLVCKKSSAEKLNCGNIIINLKEGKIEQQQKAFPLRKIIIKDGPKIIERDYHHQGFYFEIVNKNKVSHFFLMEEQPYKSMFNQMFILRNYDKRYFELVYDNFPTMVLFKVK